MQQLKSALEMPGSFGVPIISDLQFAGNEGYSLLQSWQRYGSVFKMRLLGQKCAVLIGAEANNLVLVEQAERLSSYLGWQYFVEPAFGKTLMIQDGQQHSTTRRLMMPAFHGAAIASYLETMQEIEYAGYRIEPGWTIIISQFVTHRLPEIYTNPEQFDPDRFERGCEEDKKVPFSLLGFGGGANVCIGREFALMEIKVFLATLLRYYRFSVTPEYSALAPVLVPPKTQNQLRACITKN